MKPARFDPRGRRRATHRWRAKLAPALLATLCACAPSQALARPRAPATPKPAYLSAYEAQVLREMNRVRQNPAAYAKTLAQLARRYDGRLLRLPDQPPLLTVEGGKAAREAVAALRRARPVPLLRPSRGMSRAAAAHVKDIGPKGLTSHNGADGSDTFHRLDRFGQWQQVAAENIQYGARSPQEVIQLLLVDDGVASRGHRDNILNPRFRVSGVACGAHATLRTICVITYAAGYQEK